MYFVVETDQKMTKGRVRSLDDLTKLDSDGVFSREYLTSIFCILFF